MLSDKSFTFRFRKYSFLVLRSSVTQKNPFFFFNLFFCYKCFFNFDLRIIAFLKALDMKRLLLNLRVFVLIGACLWRTAVKVFWKSEKLTVLLLLRFLSKSSFKSFIPNELQSRYNFALAMLQNFRAMLQNLVEKYWNWGTITVSCGIHRLDFWSFFVESSVNIFSTDIKFWLV